MAFLYLDARKPAPFHRFFFSYSRTELVYNYLALRRMNVGMRPFPQAEHDTWPQCERLLMQTAVAMQIIERHQDIGEVSGRLLYEAAYSLRDRAHYAEAEPLFLRALAIYEQQVGPEHLLVARVSLQLLVLQF